MPPENLHMTALEITHSLTSPEILSLVRQLTPSAEKITDYTQSHRARIVKPLLSFDAQALALSFLPAAGEPSDTNNSGHDDSYTYHHLRRDLFTLATDAGVKVASRYVVPSAHLTVARFIESSDFETNNGKIDGTKVKAFVQEIEAINEWLVKEYWPTGGDHRIKEGGEWIVGEEKGLDFRQGTLWYGGGETVRLGKGI